MRHKTLPRPALALGVAGLALALAACSPITTDVPYAASDGIRAQVGDLDVLNLMILSPSKDAAGRLLGAASSASAEPETLTIAAQDGSVTIPVQLEAGETVNFSVDDGLMLLIDQVTVAPGANLPVTLTTSAGESIDVFVPVLDSTLDEYADFVPSE
ncbi:hypothetical protein [Sanguibacter antarcticus]|uniref:Copper(I)-binding protein n=1 Tax=Sanguibacter antarcticus TaxID=372484 RepID=A0A2A9E8R4_9MICO|nr:hypothetical protein [Sanguibacter antarcticus]PFG35274.1 copper(I)-binding protein [Sanguibacter antarcticus]